MCKVRRGFLELTRVLRDLLNGNRGAAKILGTSMERDLPKRMQTLQTELVQFYNDLPENLIWSTNNFKFWVSEHKGGVSRCIMANKAELNPIES